MSSSHPTPASCRWSSCLAAALDRRSAPRFAPLLLGAALPRGRRTVTGRIRAAQLGDRFRSCPLAIAAAGGHADHIARRLSVEVVRPPPAGAERPTPAPDDTPTKRLGAHVRGAGVYHDPTPGPAGSSFAHGHVPVVPGPLVRHGARGTIALPPPSRLPIREGDPPTIAGKHRPVLRTRSDMALKMLRRVRPRLTPRRSPIPVVVDGADANKEALEPAGAPGVIVVSRPRRDAAPGGSPGPKASVRRGPAPTYGKDVIGPAERTGQRRGWPTGTSRSYGVEVVERYRTLLATRKPAGGPTRVVPVGEPNGRPACSRTDASAGAADIPGVVADRFAPGITSREVERAVGAGQQPVRSPWSSIGAFRVRLWTGTMTEARARDRDDEGLVDRSGSPWDGSSRRPSHADERRA